MASKTFLALGLFVSLFVNIAIPSLAAPAAAATTAPAELAEPARVVVQGFPVSVHGFDTAGAESSSSCGGLSPLTYQCTTGGVIDKQRITVSIKLGLGFSGEVQLAFWTETGRYDLHCDSYATPLYPHPLTLPFDGPCRNAASGSFYVGQHYTLRCEVFLSGMSPLVHAGIGSWECGADA